MQLLLGCGSSRVKKLSLPGQSEWVDPVTIDVCELHRPDIIHDLNYPLPFKHDTVREIHIYEVLEHLGRQGDHAAFFATFSDFWRVLVPDGVVFATVPLPTSVWAWGDPSHTRVIPKETLTFLHQPAYDQVGKTAMSDFRGTYKADFDIIYCKENEEILEFALRAIKPSRCKV